MKLLEILCVLPFLPIKHGWGQASHYSYNTQDQSVKIKSDNSHGK